MDGSLFDAVRCGRFRQAKLLVDAGADVNGRNNRGERPLVNAVVQLEQPILRSRFMRLLLGAGADPNSSDAQGVTAAMHAAILNRVDVLALLLEAENLNLCAQDDDGNTALMYSAAFGHGDAVALILAATNHLLQTILLEQRNKEGLTAYQLAERHEHLDAAQLLSRNRPLDPVALEKCDVRDLSDDSDTETVDLERIPDIPSRAPVRKDVQRLIESDLESRPSKRPPTPVKMSLPSLLPAQRQSLSLDSSFGSTDGRTRHFLRPDVRFPDTRSVSEPRNLNGSGDLSPDEEFEQVLDLLDASIRSDCGGWERLRRRADPLSLSMNAGASSLRGMDAGPNHSSVVTLPPIGSRLHDASRRKEGFAGAGPRPKRDPVDTQAVLTQAKKTLEDLAVPQQEVSGSRT